MVTWKMLAAVALWVESRLGFICGTTNTNYETLNNLYIDNILDGTIRPYFWFEYISK